MIRTKTQLRRVEAIAVPLSLFVTPLVLFSLVQYARYGFGLFLGWDSSTYAWSASVFSQDPIHYLQLVNYPSLYVVFLAGTGYLLGQISLAEKILPLIVALPLGYAYYRLTLHVTSDRRLAYLAALLGGLAINSLRLESDLNRNMLSFGVSMLLGSLVASDLGTSSFSIRTSWRRLFLAWLPLLAVVAYSQIETYLVLSLSLLLLASLTRNLKRIALTGSLVALPVVAALPLIWTFLLGYPASTRLIAMAAVSPLSVLTDIALYLGGFGLPCTLLGLAVLSKSARRRNPAGLFVLSWLVILSALLPIAILAGLPFERFLYVVPIPMIMAAGLKPLVQIGHRLGMKTLEIELWAWPKVTLVRKSLIPIGIMLLVVATLITSVSTTDNFLRPYVNQSDVTRLEQLAVILHQKGLSQPILVMYGPLAADLNPIYRAYFGIDSPDSFAYYGKLQYLFTLPNPTDVYSWRYDPPFELTSYLRYKAEILNQLGNVPLGSHPIVIAGGDTYDRPLSEAFINQFETSPGSGIYIIPPNLLNSNQLDDWRLYAYSDWTTKTSSYAFNASWAQAQQALGYLGKGRTAVFDANYSISLANSWSSMKLTLSFYDWPQPYVFSDTSTAILSPLEILFDNQLILTHSYGTGTPWTVSQTLPNVSSGIHTIRIRSVSNSTQTAVAVALDEIQLCPLDCT